MNQKTELLQVFEKLGSSNPNDVEAANHKIMDLLKNKNTIVPATQIIIESTNDSIIFRAAQFLQHHIFHHFMSYSTSDQVNVRNMLISRLLQYKGTNQLIIDQLNRIITEIAIKTWPEQWPDCITELFEAAKNDPHTCCLAFLQTSAIFDEIQESSHITSVRRSKLTQEIINYSKPIMDTAEWAISTYGLNNISVPLIKLLNSLCHRAPPDEILRESVLTSIFETFIPDPLTSEIALQTIRNLLLMRTDSSEIFSHNISIIMDSIENLLSVEGPFSTKFYQLVLELFTKYLPEIEDNCFELDDGKEYEMEQFNKIFSIIIQKIPIISKEFSDEGDFETFNHDLDIYWCLWKAVCRRLTTALHSKNKFGSLSHTPELFDGFIDTMQESLLRALNLTIFGGRLKNVNCKIAWMYLTSIDKASMSHFLIESSSHPTPGLCYAVGISCGVFYPKEEIALLETSNFLINLIKFAQMKNDPIYACSLIFLFSHVPRYLQSHPPVFNVFGQLIATNITNQIPFCRTATACAVYYFALNATQQCLQLKDIFSNLNSWLPSLELPNAKKLAKTVAFLGSSSNQIEVRNQLYTLLYNSIGELFSETEGDMLMKGLIIIRSLTKMKLNDIQGLFIPVIPTLMSGLESSVEKYNPIMFSEICNHITSIFHCFDYESVREPIRLFVNFGLNLGENINQQAASLMENPNAQVGNNLDVFSGPFIGAIAELRKTFPGLEEYYDHIVDIYMIRLVARLNSDPENAFQVLQFYRYFDLRPEELSTLLQLCLFFCDDERQGVSGTAVKLLRKFIEGMPPNDVINGRQSILSMAFRTLTDTFHTAIFNPLAKLLLSFIKIMETSGYPQQNLCQDILSILKELQESGTAQATSLASVKPMFLQQFIVSLTSNSGNFDIFANVIKDFLIALKFASPSDAGLFKKELKLDAIMDELQNLVDQTVSTEPKEEDDILPALKNLKL